jgi:hypothetical protein
MTESTDKEKEPTNKQLGKATVNLFRIMDIRTRQLDFKIRTLENMLWTLEVSFLIFILYEFGVFDAIGELIWSS